MPTKIFVNLPVRDLSAAIEFFTKVGFQFNPQFSDERATCMVISDDIYVMLLVEPFFRTFTPKSVADATQTTEVILSLSADSREEVDHLVDKAMAAGATASWPLPDSDFMYTRNFQDPDGHLWEVMYLNPALTEQGQPAAEISA
ncbi:glyoxalase/bleomycin resistance/extradiol dioxygenase family protein [Hymenobacter oligotrophus]|uniref:Glyoxalase/bleomycin resistance/extradiol dioxygenase family protein n=1 Tax=Hymenobacter oligotrophus TaxID=2319843 RepID=A0A3B7R0Y2_9BACT|nr:VOC family protein [Hymenobacter oligotrophus]AYA37645.1 glyoxalase/bleomycin resistance/extradiol dioxygenase family protein [Hymenobacter oligotrophus]